MNREDKMKNYVLTKKEAATILAKAWNNLDASLIEPYIAEDIIYWSQQVLTDMTGKNSVMNYLTDKMESIRKSPHDQIFAELGEAKPYPMAPDPAEPCGRSAMGGPKAGKNGGGGGRRITGGSEKGSAWRHYWPGSDH
jgi:hypothetical protein